MHAMPGVPTATNYYREDVDSFLFSVRKIPANLM